MKYLLLKVEKRCQTTIEKILKSIVDERRSPNLPAERIYVRALLLSQMWPAIKGCPTSRDGVKMARACVLHLSLTVALVPPAARLSRHVVCGGAAYDYCIQALGCTAEEAAKAERAMLPHIAEKLTRAQAEEMCSRLQSTLDLNDAELKRVVMRLSLIHI